MNKKRYNIGLAVAAITDPFSDRLSRGAMSAAEKLDVNLFILPGKYMGKDLYSQNADNKYEYQYNALFSYAAAAEFDYLIVAIGTIAYSLDSSERKKILDRFSGTPVLSVASKANGYDYLIFDNKSGIIQAVDNLVNEQGKKHIGIMCGDMNNYECAERFEAYRFALEKNGLEFKESRCMSCDLSDCCTDEAERLIELNPELDAVICVNDAVASAVYKVLNKHNKHIGKDIAVVGFDDLPFAEKLEPPLASVRADAFKLGEAAVEKALNFLSGVKDGRHFVDTEFIPRQSSYGQSGIYKSPNKVFCGSKDKIAENILLFFCDDGNKSDIYAELKKFSQSLMDDIFNRFINKKTDESDFKSVINSIDVFFNKELPTVSNITKLHGVVDSGYGWLQKAAPAENAAFVNRLYNYFYKRISLDIAADYHMLEDSQVQKSHFNNYFVKDALQIMEDFRDCYSRMLKRLCLIGSNTSFAYIFKEPIIYRNGDTLPKDIEWRFVGYSYGNDTFSVPKEEQRITSPQVFENKYLDPDRRHTLIAADLFSAEYQYGLVLCEPRSSEFFDELELVTYQLSAVVKMALIMDKQEKILMELHSKNLALEDMSRVDELTKIYNRRGFYSAAEELISAPENEGVRYIVCYADMDNLKMVNDKYGHAEGDFSIKSLAECLRELFGSSAVTGRMGGDEFAVIVPKKNAGEIGEIKLRKLEIISKLNDSAGKPYIINMSVGMVECECSNSYDLKEAIDKADGMLYEAKAKRKKKI